MIINKCGIHKRNHYCNSNKSLAEKMLSLIYELNQFIVNSTALAELTCWVKYDHELDLNAPIGSSRQASSKWVKTLRCKH